MIPMCRYLFLMVWFVNHSLCLSINAMINTGHIINSPSLPLDTSLFVISKCCSTLKWLPFSDGLHVASVFCWSHLLTSDFLFLLIFFPSQISLKVVSSMRGSREKRGLHVENLSVRWAPDVYDPTPTSQSHTVKSYNGPKMSKKSNRHKHKGKSPRSNIVDKKHRRKSSWKVAS